MKANLDFFDTSHYEEKNVFNIPRVNKQKMGLMKDEYANEIITEFIALRPKMYAVKFYKSEKEKKKCKGIKKCVVNKQLHFSDYENCLKTSNIIFKTQNCIRSKKHHLYTVREEKVALSSNDDKRYIIPNSICTLPYGYRA